MRSFSRVLSSSIERLKRRRRNQRTAGTTMRSNAAQIASALMMSASHNGSMTCDDIRPGILPVRSVARASLIVAGGLSFRGLPRVDEALEDVEAFPRGLDRFTVR